jgi:hypothetical protein
MFAIDSLGCSWSFRKESKSKYQSEGLKIYSAPAPERIEFLTFDKSLR